MLVPFMLGLCAPGDVATVAPDSGHVTVMNYLARAMVGRGFALDAIGPLVVSIPQPGPR